MDQELYTDLLLAALCSSACLMTAVT